MNGLAEAVVETSLYLPSMFTLRFHDDKLELVGGTTFTLGKEVEILLTDPSNGNLTSVMKGEITAIEPEFHEEFVANLVVRGYDFGHRLNRGSKSRVFVQSTDSDMVSKIAGENGLSVQAEATSQVHEHTFQYHQTDFEFLSRRARHVGFEMFVDDRKLYFRKPTGSRGEVALEWGTSLRSFSPRMSGAGQVNQVFVRGWDPKKKTAVVGQAATSSVSPQIGEGKWGGQAAQSAFGSAAKRVELRSPVATQTEADKLAQSILDEVNASFVEAEGVAFGNPSLLAGRKINITKVGARFSGKYMVTSSRHVYSLQGYDTYFAIEGVRPHLMGDLINPSSARTDSALGGVVVAIVTNNNDPDNLSRVKLKFPWLDDQLESSWARVTGFGAGASRGFFWLPEVNDEVLVAFEQGDFNRPYVIGSLWNGKDAIPETGAVVDSKVEKRTLKTREGHIIRLTDGSSAAIEIIDSKTNTSIKLDTTAKKITITSKGDIELSATGNFTIKGQNVNVEATANMNVEAKSNLSMKGLNSTVQANASLEMKGATGNLQASGPLTVKGAIVNIN
jgi:phage protein D/phage baseplate assembly protein gpV